VRVVAWKTERYRLDMDLAGAIERIRPSVFQMEVRIEGLAARRFPVGTAFAVSEAGWLVTALHVVEAGEQALAAETGGLLAMFAGPNIIGPPITIRASFSGQEVVVVDRDADHDLALLRTSSESLEPFVVQLGPQGVGTHPHPARIAIERPRDGEPVAISGYPLGEPALITNSGSIATAWALDSKLEDLYLGDFTANPGNSGGPVYRLSDSSVIGVCVAGKLIPIQGGAGRQTAGLTVMVPCAYVVALLAKNGVPQPVPLASQRPLASKRRSKRRK
jgi:S1-C subfamily serine protease